MDLHRFTVDTIRCPSRQGRYYAVVIDNTGQTVHTTGQWLKVDAAHAAALLWAKKNQSYNRGT